MDVRFRTEVLAQCATDAGKARRRWGQVVARTYRRRLDALEAVPSAEQLGQLPGRFHALGSDRKGQYAMDLDQGWRLILTFGATKEIVIVEEVTNHYDD